MPFPSCGRPKDVRAVERSIGSVAQHGAVPFHWDAIELARNERRIAKQLRRTRLFVTKYAIAHHEISAEHWTYFLGWDAEPHETLHASDRELLVLQTARALYRG